MTGHKCSFVVIQPLKFTYDSTNQGTNPDAHEYYTYVDGLSIGF